MTRRTCANCAHLVSAPVDDWLIYAVPKSLEYACLPAYPACNGRVEGHTLPLSVMGTCGDWTARDGD